MGKEDLSKFLCFILRHEPEAIGISMDNHGWVNIEELIEKVNQHGKYKLTMSSLMDIVYTDDKKRYSVSDGKIRCNQGHSVSYVEPDLVYKRPPDILYHGTTEEAVTKIIESGRIKKMRRHAVHLTENPGVAWKNACRWKSSAPAIIAIDAKRMYEEGCSFGVTENDVWCINEVPTRFFAIISGDEEEVLKIISDYKSKRSS